MHQECFLLSPLDLDTSPLNATLRSEAIAKGRDVISRGGVVQYGFGKNDPVKKSITTIEEFESIVLPEDKIAQQDAP